MANLSITTACSRHCRYCFARDVRAGPGPMSLEVFETALDLLSRAGIAVVRLLGGEPTLHPRFELLVGRALERGFRVVLFTGALVPDRVLRQLERLPESKLNVLVNALPPGSPGPDLARQRDLLARLGARVVLGSTIDTPGIELDFLLDWIDEHALARSVRIGLAHPVLDGTNVYLHPRHYRHAGRRVAEFGLRARARRVCLDLDCGFVPCMFPPGSLDALGLAPDQVGRRCGPVLDLLPDGRIVACYPLAAHASRRLAADSEVAELRAFFRQAQETDRRFGLSRKCEGCAWRERGECVGGCLSLSLRRLRRRGFSTVVPEVA